MKAYVLHGINDFTYEEIKKPAIGTDEVLIRVHSSGICGSDVARVYKIGTYHFPTIPGHEFAGTVVEIGANVNTKWLGKRVGVFPLIPCKTCPSCMAKKYEMCEKYNYLGSRCNGGFAEFVAVPEWNLIELPDDIDMNVAAMLEPVSVAIHAIRQIGGKEYNECYKDKAVAVCGMGTIGKITAMLLEYLGCKKIIPVNKDVHEIEEVDVYFECVGKNETILQGIQCLKPGGILQLVGNPYGDINIEKNIYWRILRKQLTLKGTWNSSFTHGCDDDWHIALTIMTERQELFKNLISHTFDLAKLETGLKIMRDKKEKYTKIMIEL